VAEICADSDGGAQTYPPGIPARVLLLRRFDEASHLPVSEARRNGLADPACGLWRLVVPLRPPGSLRPPPAVCVAFPPVAFGMMRNLRLVRQNTTQPFPSRNEGVPELPSAAQRNKLL